MAWHFMTIATMSTIGIVCVLGNLLVLISINTQKFLRTLSNMFIASMAVADLLMGLTIIPLCTIQGSIGHWVFGFHGCRYYISATVTFCVVSVFHLCSIALDRYFIVSSGVTYLQNRSVRKNLTWIGLMWISAIVLGLIPLAFDWQAYRVSDQGIEACVYPLHEPSYLLYISTVILTAMMTMQAIYVCLFIKLRTIFKSKMNLTTEEASSSCENLEISELTNGLQSLKRNKVNRLQRERKAAQLLGLITAGLVVSWLPYIITSFVAAVKTKHNIPWVVFQVTGLLAFSNSAWNPIIYTAFSPDFRNGFTNLLHLDRR